MRESLPVAVQWVAKWADFYYHWRFDRSITDLVGDQVPELETSHNGIIWVPPTTVTQVAPRKLECFCDYLYPQVYWRIITDPVNLSFSPHYLIIPQTGQII